MPSSVSSSVPSPVSSDMDGLGPGPDQANRSHTLLAQTFQGNENALQELVSGAPQITPEQAMGLLHRMGHPDEDDVLATPNPSPEWASAQKQLISAFQNRSREEPIQHLIGYIKELKKVPSDKQAKSDEFAELKKTIDRLLTHDAQRFLASFNFGPHPNLNDDAMRQLKEGVQDRAGVLVSGSKGDAQELKEAGDFGVKGQLGKSDETTCNKLNPNDPGNIDTYATLGSPLSSSYGDGRGIERGQHINLPRLQVSDKKGSLTREGYTRLADLAVRAYVVTGSSIDPTTIPTASQSFTAGVQGKSHPIHSSYSVTYEPKAVTAAGKEVKTKQEFSVDAVIGATGDLRASFSAGEYPGIQIQGSAFAGARAEVQSKAKFKVAGHDVGEFKVKANAAAAGEASGVITFGRVYDSIEGQPVTTGAEFGGMAFAGARAGVEVGADLGGIGGKLKAEGWAGIGVMSKLYAKTEDGAINFGGEHGAALGIGGAVSWGVTVNPGKMTKAFNKDLPGKIEKYIAAAPGRAGRSVVAAGRDGVRTVGNAAQRGAQNLGNAAQSGAQFVGGAAQTGARIVGDAAQSSVRTVGNAAQSGARNLRNAAQSGAQFVGGAAQTGVRSAGTLAANSANNIRQFSAGLAQKIRSRGTDAGADDPDFARV